MFAVTTSFAQNVQWHKMSYPLNYTPTDIKKAGDMLYMTTLENTYFASEDNGNSWKIVADLKFGMLSLTTGATQFIDENNNIIMYPGMSSSPSSLRQSKDNANTWESLKVLQRSNILSITNWKNGFVCIKSEYNDNLGHVFAYDTTQQNDDYYENELFGKCFTLDSVYFINYSGIYSSHFDTIIPKKIIQFPTKTKSFSLYMNDKSCFVTAGNFLFFTHDNGRTWEKDTLPFIPKHLQKNSRNFYAIDNDNLLWKLTSDGRQWAKFLSFPIDHDSITCFYADDENLFFGGSKGLLHYSLQSSTWLNNIDLGSISSYTVKLTDRGICVNPTLRNSLAAIPLGFCHTKDLGKSWNIYNIHPYGMMLPYVHSKTIYRNGRFYQFDASYNIMMSFGLGSGDFFRDIAPSWTYFLQKEDTSFDISRACDSIRIYTKDSIIKYKLILPESPKRIYHYDLHQITFSLIKDTLFYSLDDSIPERKIYYSMNFGKSWSLYNNWKKKYKATGVPIRFGKYIRRFHPTEGFQIYNSLSDSWHTINDSRWGTTKYSDIDYNDSLIVVGHTTGVYYLTPEDIPALTSLQEATLEQIVNIYPMPFEDILTLTLPTHKADITIFSLMGIPLFSTHNEHSNTYTLNTEYLPKGVYYIQIATDNSTIRQSIIKL